MMHRRHRRRISGKARAGARASEAAPDHPLLDLQRSAGNRAVTKLLRGGGRAATAPRAAAGEADASLDSAVVVEEELVPDPSVGAPDTAPIAFSFVDLGMTGTAPFGGPADPRLRRHPHAFTNGGQTGTVPWSGGGGSGAHGNEGSGSIQAQVPPVFVSSAGPTAGRFSSRIQPGTGTVAVTRSFLGAFAGSQGGNGWFLTAAAAARVNQHEVRHVNSTSAIYAATLAPLEARVANAALGIDAGVTEAAAIANHRFAIQWVPTIASFQTQDTTANQPGGTTDTVDTATAGTWIVDNGPGTVGGTAFTHIVTNAGEAMPAP